MTTEGERGGVESYIGVHRWRTTLSYSAPSFCSPLKIDQVLGQALRCLPHPERPWVRLCFVNRAPSHNTRRAGSPAGSPTGSTHAISQDNIKINKINTGYATFVMHRNGPHPGDAHGRADVADLYGFRAEPRIRAGEPDERPPREQATYLHLLVASSYDVTWSPQTPKI